MTRDVETIPPDASLQQAAEAMEATGVGSLPVCDGRRLVTDRDIVVRGAATGQSPVEMLVRDCMTDDISYAFEDEDAEAVLARMKTLQIRRLASPPNRAPRICARSARPSPRSQSPRGRTSNSWDRGSDHTSP
jgi:predicted transcriptional regulator